MVELILWRHAEAEEGTNDLARGLTAKGQKQAEKIARFLSPHLAADARILVSPALRTRQTATALTQQFTLAPTLAPGATAAAVFHAASGAEGDGTVLVVGHQPTLGSVAAELLGMANTSLSIKKGALWWFTQRERDGVRQTTLRLVMTPEFL